MIREVLAHLAVGEVEVIPDARVPSMLVPRAGRERKVVGCPVRI